MNTNEPKIMGDALARGWEPLSQDAHGTWMRAPRRWRPLVFCLLLIGGIIALAAHAVAGLIVCGVALADYFFAGKRTIKHFPR